MDGSNLIAYPGWDHRQGVKTFLEKYKGVETFFDKTRGAKSFWKNKGVKAIFN